jgi:cobalt/nickel transport system permease protein
VNALLQVQGQGGWVQALDPRLRIVAAVLFALTVVSLRGLPALVLAFAAALALVLSSGIPRRRVLARLLPLELFILVLLLTLPFTVAGDPLFRIGPLTATLAGVAFALSILLKANAVVLVMLALLASLEPALLGHALARLGLPHRLAHLFLLTLRQIELVGAEYGRLRQAMRARAFVPRSDRHTWNCVGWLMGMLLVRSLDRSQRVLDAMRCRGFDGRLRLLDTLSWRITDSALLLLALLLSVTLLAIDYLLGGLSV